MYSLDRTSFCIDIKTVALLQILKRNAEEHENEFIEANSIYDAKCVEMLEERLRLFKSGRRVNMHFDISPPKSHIRDYKMAIEMVEKHEGETFSLNSSAYRQLVKNRWDWSSDFKMSLSKIAPHLVKNADDEDDD